MNTRAFEKRREKHFFFGLNAARLNARAGGAKPSRVRHRRTSAVQERVEVPKREV